MCGKALLRTLLAARPVCALPASLFARGLLSSMPSTGLRDWIVAGGLVTLEPDNAHRFRPHRQQGRRNHESILFRMGFAVAVSGTRRDCGRIGGT
jgi:hypothetical protein